MGGWGAMLIFSQELALSSLCVAATGAWYDQGWRSLQAMLAFVSPVRIALSWFLMLTAMMTPILAGPLHHVWVRSFARRRWRSIAVFIAAYLVVWMAMAPVLVLGVAVLRITAGWLLLPVGGLAVAIALIWQAAPIKQFCLNRCHWTPRIGVFGGAADGDCARYGLVNGLWCVGTCWALMLVPITATDMPMHLGLMACVAVIMVMERLEPARPARWHMPLAGVFGWLILRRLVKR
jgi:predicted metal-binding membrane protein|tara:strand:+ start:8010 stop:8714 length:705 start_codon:yes stop_codon:yes gene_type:complete